MFQKNYQWYPKITDGTQNDGQSGSVAIFWTPKMMKIDQSIKCARKFGYRLYTILGTIRHFGYHWGAVLGTIIPILCTVKIESLPNFNIPWRTLGTEWYPM